MSTTDAPSNVCSTAGPVPDGTVRDGAHSTSTATPPPTDETSPDPGGDAAAVDTRDDDGRDGDREDETDSEKKRGRGRPQVEIRPESGPIQFFACELRELRESYSTPPPTYKEMAAKVNCSRTSLSTAARGVQLPTFEAVRWYLKALDHDSPEQLAMWKRKLLSARKDLLAGRIGDMPGGEGATDDVSPHAVRRERRATALDPLRIDVQRRRPDERFELELGHGKRSIRRRLRASGILAVAFVMVFLAGAAMVKYTDADHSNVTDTVQFTNVAPQPTVPARPSLTAAQPAPATALPLPVAISTSGSLLPIWSTPDTSSSVVAFVGPGTSLDARCRRTTADTTHLRDLQTRLRTLSDVLERRAPSASASLPMAASSNPAPVDSASTRSQNSEPITHIETLSPPTAQVSATQPTPDVPSSDALPGPTSTPGPDPADNPPGGPVQTSRNVVLTTTAVVPGGDPSIQELTRQYAGLLQEVQAAEDLVRNSSWLYIPAQHGWIPAPYAKIPGSLLDIPHCA